MVSDEVVRETAAQRGLPADQICPCETWADFDTWALGVKGEAKLRRALAENWLFGEGMRALANQWLSHKEVLRQAQGFQAAVDLAHRATRAAEKTARWAMASAVLTALCALVTAGSVLTHLYRQPPPMVVQFQLDPPPMVLTPETELSMPPSANLAPPRR